ncbi:MAG: hypothetical protein NC112_03385 [Oxalobacter formigenes]|nr:hypothetical protein [Oxalobacter formigenes]
MGMRKAAGWLLTVPFAATLALASPWAAAEKSATQEAVRTAVRQTDALDFPVVTLKHWTAGTDAFRYGFLIGFTSAIEMEKEWQGKKPLPLEESLTQTWARGFDHVTLKEIGDNINAYIAANPNNSDVPLVEYLWYAYAQPQVNEKVSGKKLEGQMQSKWANRIQPVMKGGR